MPTLKDDNGCITHMKRSNILNNYFSTVHTKEKADNLPSLDNSPYVPINLLNVTVNGIASFLCGLNVHKACGPDGIYPRLLRKRITMLLLLYQASLK